MQVYNRPVYQLVSCNFLLLGSRKYSQISISADQDNPQRLHNPGLSRKMDAADQDGHPGSSGVVGSQSGEGGPSGPRGLLLRKPLLQPLLQVQQERGQAPRGTLLTVQIQNRLNTKRRSRCTAEHLRSSVAFRCLKHKHYRS